MAHPCPLSLFPYRSTNSVALSPYRISCRTCLATIYYTHIVQSCPHIVHVVRHPGCPRPPLSNHFYFHYGSHLHQHLHHRHQSHLFHHLILWPREALCSTYVSLSNTMLKIAHLCEHLCFQQLEPLSLACWLKCPFFAWRRTRGRRGPSQMTRRRWGSLLRRVRRPAQLLSSTMEIETTT